MCMAENADRVTLLHDDWRKARKEHRCAECGRWISEAMHRRVLALVRAVDEFATDESRRPGLFIGKILDAHAALRAQAEKEAK